MRFDFLLRVWHSVVNASEYFLVPLPVWYCKFKGTYGARSSLRVGTKELKNDEEQGEASEGYEEEAFAEDYEEDNDEEEE